MPATFSQQLNGFSVKIFRMNDDVFHGCTEEVQRSIVEGSEITTSKGQPVGQYGPGYNEGAVGGVLKASWTPQFTSKTTWQTTTHLNYAPQEEDGISYAHGEKPITHRSTVGGFHSVKLTRIHWERIVEFVTRKVRGNNGT